MSGFADVLTAVPVREAQKSWRPISLEQLRAHLIEDRPIPKEGFIDTDIAGLHSNAYRHRDRQFERAVLHALMGPAATQAEHKLALDIANCRRNERCKRLSCYICNQRYWGRRRALLGRLSRRWGDDEISWCTLVIGTSQLGYPILKTMIADFKAAFTATLDRFSCTQWSGRLEIDYIDQSVCKVQPKKVITLNQLNWDQSSEMPTLVPHAHLVIGHPGVRREVLGYHLRRAFPGYARVQVRPFRVTCDREVSLDQLVRYTLKPPLDHAFWRARSTKSPGPRHPKVVRYAIKIREVLDRAGKRRNLEFDRY